MLNENLNHFTLSCKLFAETLVIEGQKILVYNVIMEGEELTFELTHIFLNFVNRDCLSFNLVLNIP